MQKYVFTQEDLKYVQDLLPNEVQVFLRNDNTTMDICYNKRNKYVDKAIFTLNEDFYKEIENYFSKIGEITFNNTRDCWWMYY